MTELDLLRQQISILRADMDQQMKAIDTAMTNLTQILARVANSLDARITSCEETLKQNGMLAEAPQVPATGTDKSSIEPDSGKEL